MEKLNPEAYVSEKGKKKGKDGASTFAPLDLRPESFIPLFLPSLMDPGMDAPFFLVLSLDLPSDLTTIKPNKESSPMIGEDRRLVTKEPVKFEK